MSKLPSKMLTNFIEITLWHGFSPVNLLHIFRTHFPKNISGWLLLKVILFEFYFTNLESGVTWRKVRIFRSDGLVGWFILFSFLARNLPVIRKDCQYFKVILGLFQLFMWRKIWKLKYWNPKTPSCEAHKLVRLSALSSLNEEKDSTF